jgi:type I restriction enzyme S subunit
MKMNWPQENLGSVLTRRKDEVLVQELESYKRLTIRMNGRGMVIRDVVDGSTIGTKHQFVVKAGQLVLSKIDARNGAFGVLPEDCDGAIITGNFWAFDVDPNRLYVRYLDYLTKTHLFVDFCIRASEGTTNRRYLQEPRFLAQRISLPPIEEQRRIVARIEELSAKIEEARILRKQAAGETLAFFASSLTTTFDSSNWPLKLLPEVAEVARGKFAHRPRNEPRFYGGDIPFIQIGDISNSNRYIRAHSQTLNQDGLRISRIFPVGTLAIAITGATIGVTGILDFNSCFPDSIVGIQAKPGSMTPEFLYLTVEHAKRAALAEATQTTQPNINLGNLQRLHIRVPPLSEQRRTVAYLDDLQSKVDTVKGLQDESESELNALMPSILSRAFAGDL